MFRPHRTDVTIDMKLSSISTMSDTLVTTAVPTRPYQRANFMN